MKKSYTAAEVASLLVFASWPLAWVIRASTQEQRK